MLFVFTPTNEVKMIDKKTRYNRKPKERKRRVVLLALLDKKSISQMELAEAAGISYKTVNWVINHPDKTVHLKTALGISQALGVSIETLF